MPTMAIIIAETSCKEMSVNYGHAVHVVLDTVVSECTLGVSFAHRVMKSMLRLKSIKDTDWVSTKFSTK